MAVLIRVGLKKTLYNAWITIKWNHLNLLIDKFVSTIVREVLFNFVFFLGLNNLTIFYFKCHWTHLRVVNKWRPKLRVRGNQPIDWTHNGRYEGRRRSGNKVHKNSFLTCRMKRDFLMKTCQSLWILPWIKLFIMFILRNEWD